MPTDDQSYNLNSKISMLQRHQRNNLGQLIQFAKQQLEDALKDLSRSDLKTAPLYHTAQAILDMYSNLSYPFIGLQVVKESMTNMKHPHLSHMESILSKAEIFYLESVKFDLEKIKQQKSERLSFFNVESIQEYIRETNWKMGFDKESILNESQDVGDNIDLMKFFEGVRNYQNWEDNMQKRTIEKLKKYAIKVQSELTLQRGFILSKVQSLLNNKNKQLQQDFFSEIQRKVKLQSKLQIFDKILLEKIKASLQNIKITSRTKSSSQKLQQLIIRLGTASQKRGILTSVRELSKSVNKLNGFRKIMQQIVDKKTLWSSHHFFKVFMMKGLLRSETIGRASEKLLKILKKIAVKQIARAVGLEKMPLCNSIVRLFNTKNFSYMKTICEVLEASKPRKAMISEKIKGKILLSILKYENKPINLRKVFLNWYLKGHEEKYSRMIYNIWLNGSISKFTFFMRIKNLINEGKRQKIRQQLKIFLMILGQKLGNYYNHCQKGFLNKWKDQARRSKNLLNLVAKLQVFVHKVNQQIVKGSLQKISQFSKKVQLLTKYFNKKMGTMQNRCKTGFDVWKAIPNIKKSKGEIKLLRYLRQKLSQLQSQQREVFEIFRQNQIKGHETKIRFLTKVFTKDLAYSASFFNMWRRNVKQHKSKTIFKQETSNLLKSFSLKQIEDYIKRQRRTNAKQALVKFIQNSRFAKRRHDYTLKIFERTLSRYYNNSLEATFRQFKTENNKSHKIKDKLIVDLVSANKMKQAQVLYIWKTIMQAQRIVDKKQMLIKCFGQINNILKDMLQINRPVYRSVSAISQKYKQNVQNALGLFKKLPMRVNWNKRRNAGQMFKKLEFLVHRGMKQTYDKYKQSSGEGNYKKRKVLNFMYYQICDSTKKYFRTYMHNVRSIKITQRHKVVTKIFNSVTQVENMNFSCVFLAEKQWQKKAQSFNKFNQRALNKVRQAFKIWNQNYKAMKFYDSLLGEKKKRILSIVSDMLSKNSFAQTKNCISLFKKNSKIMIVQANFLKKLCDSQAGKVIKAMMIWKNLPQPKNKQLIAKASKFEGNLHFFAQKLLRTTLNVFKDASYFGNDKKKLAIRKLVAKSCSGISKYFQIWKKNNKLITLFSQCHRTENLMQIMFDRSQKNISFMILGDRAQRVSQSFTSIQKWWMKNQLRLFQAWRGQTVRLKQQDNLKKNSLLDIERIRVQVDRRKTVQIIQTVKKRNFLRSIVGKYFIQRVKNNTYECIKSMKNLPDRKKIALNNEKVQRVLRLVEKLQSENHNDKLTVFNLLRDIKYQGNYKKIKACQAYLKDYIGFVHKLLGQWRTMMLSDKQKAKQQSVLNLFSSAFDSCRNNYGQMLQSTKQTTIKKRCFDKLFSALDIKKKGLFIIWRGKTKQLRLNQQMNDTKKKMILEKINALISGTSNQKIKATIQNFHKNSKISQVQIRFIQRLLQTKSGKALQAFGKWKKIPNQNLRQNFKKGQKFFFKLEGMVKKKFSQTYQNFKENGQEGGTIKKQSVIQLLEITSLGTRRYYNRWIRMTKNDIILKQASFTMRSVDTLNQYLVQNLKILFENQRAIRIKTKAIERILQATGQNISIYFRLWRESAKQIKVFQELNNKQKKQHLSLLTRALKNSQFTQIKEIIEKFKKNNAINKISRNFLNKLLKTKSGKVVQLFQLWKSIPDVKMAKMKKKAIKFESNLNKFAVKLIKNVYQPFRASSYEARNKKKFCIQKLIRASMGEEKKKFILWRQIIKEDKMLKHTHLFDSVFEGIQSNLSNSLGTLFRSSGEEVSKKKNLCRKLINNSNFVQYHAYFIWKQTLNTDNIKIEREESKIRHNLLNLVSVSEKVNNRKAIQIIACFKLKQLLKVKQQQNTKRQRKNKNGVQFYEKMSNFAASKLGSFFWQVQKSHNQALIISKNKLVQSSLKSLEDVLSDNLMILMRSNAQTLVMQKALNKIFSNLNHSLQTAFNQWRSYKNVLALQAQMNGQKKKNVLNILNNILNSQSGIRVPYVIEKFAKNFKSIKLRKEILHKILMCKAGKVPLAFMKWKALPNPGAKKLKQKAVKFENQLNRFASIRMKFTLEKFKEQSYEGNSKKKNVIRKLILVSMSDSNKYFNKWRKLNNEYNITEKVKRLTKFFDSASTVTKKSLLIFEESGMESKLKARCIRKIFENNEANLSQVIKIWHHKVQQKKQTSLCSILAKVDPDYVNQGYIQQAFNSIKNYSEKQAIRTYVNSLWKWKMSNVQANYYSKYIKIYEQSEELINLSKTFNKKYYENVHSAFRKIACESTSRHLRKKHLVEKYLTRKISNYFQRFKTNACFEEIKTWRNLYKQTIKGKGLCQNVLILARKQLQIAFNSISNYSARFIASQRIYDHLVRVQSKLIRASFDRIATSAHQYILFNFWSILQSQGKQRMASSLETLRNMYKVQSLSEGINKLVDRQSKRQAYSKIYHKSVLAAKAKIGINLLICLKSHAMSFELRQVINSFVRNIRRRKSAQRVAYLLQKKYRQNMKLYYSVTQDGLDKKNLLSRFKKGSTIKKILDKQDQKAIARIFQKLKKKDNKWIASSIKRFVIRSNIKSSVAVSLWRLKNYESSKIVL